MVLGKEGEHHPSWRSWARPVSPHMTSPGASQIQEVARKGGGEGERSEDPVHNAYIEQFKFLRVVCAQTMPKNPPKYMIEHIFFLAQTTRRKIFS